MPNFRNHDSMLFYHYVQYRHSLSRTPTDRLLIMTPAPEVIVVQRITVRLT